MGLVGVAVAVLVVQVLLQDLQHQRVGDALGHVLEDLRERAAFPAGAEDPAQHLRPRQLARVCLADEPVAADAREGLLGRGTDQLDVHVFHGCSRSSKKKSGGTRAAWYLPEGMERCAYAGGHPRSSEAKTSRLVFWALNLVRFGPRIRFNWLSR